MCVFVFVKRKVSERNRYRMLNTNKKGASLE